MDPLHDALEVSLEVWTQGLDCRWADLVVDLLAVEGLNLEVVEVEWNCHGWIATGSLVGLLLLRHSNLLLLFCS